VRRFGVRGEMLLTQQIANGLREAFIARTVPRKKPTPATFHSGGTWFCPSCGVPMQEISGTNGVVCPKCCGNLGLFLYWLIERHPHRFGNEWDE